jgi:hypothetical protein
MLGATYVVNGTGFDLYSAHIPTLFSRESLCGKKYAKKGFTCTMAIRLVEFWPSPMWGKRYDNTEQVTAMFADAFERIKAANPLVSLHVTVEVGDRYRNLRGRLAKRAALARKGKGVKCLCGHVQKTHTVATDTVGSGACRNTSCDCERYVPTPTHSVGKVRKSTKLLKKKLSGTF